MGGKKARKHLSESIILIMGHSLYLLELVVGQ